MSNLKAIEHDQELIFENAFDEVCAERAYQMFQAMKEELDEEATLPF